MNEDFIRQEIKKIADSDIFLSLVTENYLKNGQAALEIGLAIFLDKPIRLLVREGTKISNNLVKVAEKIEYFRAEDDIQIAAGRLLKCG